MKDWKPGRNPWPKSPWKRKKTPRGKQVKEGIRAFLEERGLSRERIKDSLEKARDKVAAMEVPEVLTRLAKPPAGEPPPERDKGEHHLSLVKESLQALLRDPRVPGEVKEALAEDYREIEAMFEKIEHEHIHIAVFGRV
ncbi:MAG: hypothetical protein D6819_05005, partial [Gammaproteobacteria bacterium]